MKSLVIAEKPSVARDIARVLNCHKKLPGAFEGERYIVTWALGHLVTLADPENYDGKYKAWKMEDLPLIPQKWELNVIPNTAKQYKLVKAQLFRGDVKEIVIATDAGREGELVARWILAKSNSRKPLKRLWISSVTDKAIREGFTKLKDGREYTNLYAAAESRAKADWLVGINATRALTCKYNAQLSCGRVQTPTLAMIALREEQIRDFKPENYWSLDVQAKNIHFTWQDEKSGSIRSFHEERLNTLAKDLEGGTLNIKTVKKVHKKQLSPALYDLTELQREANKRFGYSAKETLSIMQRLYENHKVLTYPRTDSRYLSSDIVPTLKERLQAIRIGPYQGLIGPLLRTPIKANRHFVDDSKVSDHHAIIPTEEYVQMDHLTNEERKIYDLVVRRFLSVLYPPFEYEQTTITASRGHETFTARGKVIKERGWQSVYETHLEDEDEGEVKDQTLPPLIAGSTLNISGARVISGKTKPPSHFTEGTLLSGMENPTKYMTGATNSAKNTLVRTGGLGTVATRADIIEKLFSSFLIEKRDKSLFITAKGKQLLELVPRDLKEPQLTATWETELQAIAEGKKEATPFLEEITRYTKEVLSEIKRGEATFRHDNVTNKKCPDCGKLLLAVQGKNARMLVCQDRECGYRETIARTSNARCPNCHKKMELIKKGDTETFVCKCGYKEKLEAFKARRAKEGAGVSKRDVQKYMKNQNQESVGSSLGDMLKNLELK